MASVAVSTMSTLTQEGQPLTNSSTRKKQNRAVKQRIKRKAEQQTEPDKYSKILVLGLSHTNKFTHEFQARVDDGSSRTDYALSNGKTTPSKDVSDAIRGYHYVKHLSKMTIFSEKYATLNNQIQFNRVKKLVEEKKIEAIFFDYFQMADNVWLDVLNDKIRSRLGLLIAENEFDIVFPFSKCLIDFFHSTLDMSNYDVSILTEDNIGKHNHPLFSVDDHPGTQTVLEKYHFNLNQSISSLGQLTKEMLLDTWDHESIAF